MKRQIFIDLDGVIANWTLGMSKAYNIPYPKNTILKPWGLEAVLTRSQISVAHAPLKFWMDLEVFPWANELIDIVAIACPEWHFLTKACNSPLSWAGKAFWIDNHFPKYDERLIICRDSKSFIGKPGDILIDDHPVNIKEWNAMGGNGFLWQEITPDFDYKPQLEELKEFLTKK
jgi:5'(3')-deoxyribonucleotidase